MSSDGKMIPLRPNQQIIEICFEHITRSATDPLCDQLPPNRAPPRSTTDIVLTVRGIRSCTSVSIAELNLRPGMVPQFVSSSNSTRIGVLRQTMLVSFAFTGVGWTSRSRCSYPRYFSSLQTSNFAGWWQQWMPHGCTSGIPLLSRVIPGVFGCPHLQSYVKRPLCCGANCLMLLEDLFVEQGTDVDISDEHSTPSCHSLADSSGLFLARIPPNHGVLF
jgi:hypothetical protein